MNARKLTAKLAATALFGAGLAGVTAFTGAGPAMACDASPQKSYHLAAQLPQVRYGQHNTFVLAMQLELREVGYRTLRGTGRYDAHTLNAVKHFQRRHHIKASGIVGPKTWRALVGPQDKGVTMDRLPAVRDLPRFTVRPGDRDDDHLSSLFELMQRGPVDQKRFLDAWDDRSYNPAVVQLVKEFQIKNGIKPSGIVGQQTWLALYRVVHIIGGWGC
jgi:peptidoglycan hydrolase-like protein with peptidoglycan-binding domain